MITLTPKIYKQEIKHSLLSNNKIDTVNLHPIINTTDDDAIFYSKDVNKVDINGTMYDLPISRDIPATHFHSSRNYHWGNIIVGTKEFAKARVECLLVSGKTKCKADRLILGDPTVNIQLKGISKIVARGGSTYDSYPSFDTLNSNDTSIADWVATNCTDSISQLTGDYTANVLSMNPWVRNVVDISTSLSPVPNDVITSWVTSSAANIEAVTNAWTENSNFQSSEFKEFRMISPNRLNSDPEGRLTSFLVMTDMFLRTKKSVVKLDDYTYEVSWTLPIRVAYAAASRGFNIIGQKHEVDNYAFLDEITDIHIELSGLPITTDSQDISYGLTNVNTLTTVTHGLYPIDIDAEEAMTLDTWSGNQYSYASAGTLLLGYYVDPTGALQSHQGVCVTNFIKVDKGDIVTARYNDALTLLNQATMYDGSFKFISPLPVQTTTTGGITFEILQDGYIRLNGKTSDYITGNYQILLKGRYPWYAKLAEELLVKYKDGKYTAECSVDASWALANKVTINTQMQIKLLNNDFIARNEIPCIFAVKNIEKKFRQKEFIFTLKLLEV